MRKSLLICVVLGSLLAGVLAGVIGCSQMGSGTGAAYPPSPVTPAGNVAKVAETVNRTGMADELWVIEKSDPKRASVKAPMLGDVPFIGRLFNEGSARSQASIEGENRDAILPGQGELCVIPPGEQKMIPLPLKHTDVRAQVSAFIASVNVTQIYQNPYDTKIEAVYVFPLPEDGAVTDFVMTIGERHIRGVIREREEARKIYEEARQQGYVASLLTQERPNIFTQKVANIEPGKTINVEIVYFNPLRYENGQYEFVFPMVVGPRYNPSGWTDGVGAVSREKSGKSGQATEVTYLKPTERSGHDISLSVDIEAGVPIDEIKSHSHVVDVKRESPSRVKVALSPNDSIPNKDFVLRYKVAGRKLQTAMLTHRSEKGNTFALVLQPPENLKDLPRMPREMVFVLDVSGSMQGWPLEKSKDAMRRALKKLDADDTFQIVLFASNAELMSSKPLQATPENIRRGLEYLERAQSGGGTEMLKGFQLAMDFPHDERRLRIVSFLTDGYIGNEAQIFAAVKEKLGPARIFSFGIGNSVNRYLIEGLARLGHGAAAVIGTHEGATEAVDMFYDRATRPALTDVAVEFDGMKVDSVYPKLIPDLFVGRPVLVTGHFSGNGKATIRIKGRVGTEERTYTMDVNLDDAGAQHKAITSVWARRKIAELSDSETQNPSNELREEITSVSLQHKVLCRYTAFLAVDSSRKTEGDHGVTVPVAVPVPDGVRYETTVDK